MLNLMPEEGRRGSKLWRRKETGEKGKSERLSKAVLFIFQKMLTMIVYIFLAYSI